MEGHKTLILSLTGFLFLAFSTCQSEDTVELEYPMVMTLAADHITWNSARLNAEITDGSAESISEYGFVWGTSNILNVRDSEKVTTTGSPVALTYSQDITYEQDASQTYFVRSYIKSGELIIYGNLISFIASDKPPSGFYPALLAL